MTALATTNGTTLAPHDDAAIMERVIIAGDLSKLQPKERVQYYAAVCRSVGLNPLTKPFEYIQLNGKLTLYALKACTDQLRQIHRISVTLGPAVVDVEAGIVERAAKATHPDGRSDEDVGVCVLPKGGEARANALMKAATKAKRRVTLSICGLSLLDESELDTVRDAKQVTVTAAGEVLDAAPVTAEPEQERAPADSAMVTVPWKKSEDYGKPLGSLPRAKLHSMRIFVAKSVEDPKRKRYIRENQALLDHIDTVIQLSRDAEASGEGMEAAIAGRELEPWNHPEDRVGDGDDDFPPEKPVEPTPDVRNPYPYTFGRGPFAGKTVRDLSDDELGGLINGPSAAMRAETLHACREEWMRRGLQ